MENKIIVQHREGRYWILAQDLTYRDITVPKGFLTDLATTPRILWPIFPPFGNYMRASIFHDYLLYLNIDKNTADDVFYELMLLDGVNIIVANLFYYSVKVGRFFTSFYS